MNTHQNLLTEAHKSESHDQWQCCQCTLIQQGLYEKCRLCGCKRLILAENDYCKILGRLKEMGYSAHQCNAAYSQMIENDNFVNIQNIVQWLIDQENTDNFEKQLCDILSCDSLQRISTVMKFYNKANFVAQKEEVQNSSAEFTEKLEIYEYINDKFCNGQYSFIKLLDDFHHLLFEHDNQFENIYNHFVGKTVLTEPCDRKSCVVLSRNHRDRFQCSSNENLRQQLYYGNNSSEEVTIYQLIDTIHCYYLHSYDSGFRLTRKELNSIELIEETKDNDLNQTIIKFVDIIKSKNNGTQDSCSNRNKFNSENMFSLGNDFIYPEWRYYSHIKQLMEQTNMYVATNGYINYMLTLDTTGLIKMIPIPYKYCSLQDELLNNGICTISISQWTDLLIKAKNYLKSGYCRQFEINNDAKEEEDIDMIRFDKIKMEHLMSVMIYCGYDLLSHRFCETYRKVSTKESDESLKNRHSNFAHLGQFLRETCIIFNASRLSLIRNEDLPYYHGINKIMQFNRTLIVNFSPFSTSRDLAVAVSFATDNGLILSIKTDIHPFAIDVFHCWLISPFVNEQETLLFGTRHVRITNIVVAYSGYSYELYLYVLNYIEIVLSGDNDYVFNVPDNLQKPVTQMLFKLLSHELNRYQSDKYNRFNGIPKYIEDMLHYYCTTQIVLGIWQAGTLSGWVNFQHSRSAIYGDLMILSILFPNLSSIEIIEKWLKDNVNESAMKLAVDDIVLFVKIQAGMCKVTQITYFLQNVDLLDRLVEIYNSEFNKLDWSIVHCTLDAHT
eukprot:370388_1